MVWRKLTHKVHCSRSFLKRVALGCFAFTSCPVHLTPARLQSQESPLLLHHAKPLSRSFLAGSTDTAWRYVYRVIISLQDQPLTNKSDFLCLLPLSSRSDSSTHFLQCSVVQKMFQCVGTWSVPTEQVLEKSQGFIVAENREIYLYSFINEIYSLFSAVVIYIVKY